MPGPCPSVSAGWPPPIRRHADRDGNLLWSPAGAAGSHPLVLLGHGGGQHKKAKGLVARAHRYVMACGFAVAAIDAPGHGDQPGTEQDKRFAAGILELSAGNLSQHLSVLENAGLITIEKGYAGKRARTWITLTKAGDAALAEEITQLKLLISQIECTGTSPD